MATDKPLTKENIDVNKEDAAGALIRVREGKGLTLRDIHAVTKITLSSLEAIERGDFHLLPEPVYAKNFIKSYARVLEIDPQPLLYQYDNYLKALNKPKTPPADDGGGEKAAAAKEKKGRLARIVTVRNAAVLLVAVILVIFAVYFLSEHEAPTLPAAGDRQPAAAQQPAAGPGALAPPGGPGAAPSSPAPGAQQAPTVAAAAPGKTAAAPLGAETTSRPAPSAAGTVSASPLRLKIGATEKTWLRITADNGRQEEVTLHRGEAIERNARESFQIDIGNAGGVQVWFQDRPLPALGQKGEVRHLRLP
ncbi:MAG TPA: DUF4115 domain-containing protein [Syntrophales bacterium]|nr:DUF4115 domain-containing protein [Syntrophales bacterium]HQI36476.1 DUF4115 domain-containing protein [Syntrophales bacterium]HRU89134.1 DUF4115 domain-containing protein [Syntrophales bacterium]